MSRLKAVHPIMTFNYSKMICSTKIGLNNNMISYFSWISIKKTDEKMFNKIR